jgi:hypothetical protein
MALRLAGELAHRPPGSTQLPDDTRQLLLLSLAANLTNVYERLAGWGVSRASGDAQHLWSAAQAAGLAETNRPVFTVPDPPGEVHPMLLQRVLQSILRNLQCINLPSPGGGTWHVQSPSNPSSSPMTASGWPEFGRAGLEGGPLPCFTPSPLAAHPPHGTRPYDQWSNAPHSRRDTGEPTSRAEDRGSPGRRSRRKRRRSNSDSGSEERGRRSRSSSSRRSRARRRRNEVRDGERGARGRGESVRPSAARQSYARGHGAEIRDGRKGSGGDRARGRR